MSRREPPHCQDALRWLKERGWSLAPLTGQDYPVLISIAHCWQLWTRSDNDGREVAIEAVAVLLGACQEVCWPMARELIAHAGDWSHRAEVWPQVVRAFDHRAGVGADARERVQRLARCHEGHSLVEGQRRPLSLVRDGGSK